MGFGDFCNTGLSLGLGYELKNENRVLNYDHRLFNQSILTIQTGNSVEPSLTLGLSDESYEHGRKIDTKKGYEELVEVHKRGSSPHNTTTVSSFSSVKREKDFGSEEVGTEKVSSRVSDEDEEGSARKKLRLTKEQSALLEDSFKEHSTLNPKQKQALAKNLNLRPRQVEVWFQNRRARTKLKQTEVDCDFLKKCCEKLTEENGILKKELQELRVLKLGPAGAQFYMQLPSAATITICPSCERINGGVMGEQSSSSSKNPFTIMAAKSNFLNSMTHHPSAAC